MNLLHWLIAVSGRKIILPFYHAVSDKKLPHLARLYDIRTISGFINDLDTLCKTYKPVSADGLFHIVAGNSKPEAPVFHLSFDDGFSEFYSIAAPILEQKGIPATVFVNTAFIDNKDLFYRCKVSLILDSLEKIHTMDFGIISNITGQVAATKKDLETILHRCTIADTQKINAIAEYLAIDFNTYLKSNRLYLTSEEIIALKQRGFTIGSHSVNHPHFKDISQETQQLQVSESFQFLNENFGISEKYFSFPFSDENVSASFFKWLYDVEKCRLSFGISGLKDDLYRMHLHRIPAETLKEISEKTLEKEYFYFLLKGFLNKNKIRRK